MGYEPSPEFQQNAKDPLVELKLTDSSELWLIQWPLNQRPDFDGQEVRLKLHHDGHLGSFEGSSGKSYDIVSFASQHPDATVFSSSTSKTETVGKSNMLAVGKIARRVSFVHYPEPEEIQEQNPNDLKQMYEKSATLTNSSNRFATPAHSSRSKHLQLGSGLTSTSHGSRRKGSLFASEDLVKTPKRKHVDEPTKSKRQLAQGSDQSRSVVPSSGSLEHSEVRKSKKRNNK
ncbi:Mediator-associated protein 2 [Heracleum sosnowskyi]|uniref:Mediator-associated protein 2 n=1 Tax=Heracleum sosnowskyi TaxID=360622 RepID=A0AAD8MZ10_9APIA|nr:Mediator-associated protein 2 [Heracleum sosnowskyi]